MNIVEQQIGILSGLGEFFFKDGKGTSVDRERARSYVEQAVEIIERIETKPDPLSYDTYELLGKIWVSFYNPSNAQKTFIKAVRLKLDKPPAEAIGAILAFSKHMIELGAPKLAIGPLADAGKRAVAAKLPEAEMVACWAIGDLMAGKFRDLPVAKKYLDRGELLEGSACPHYDSEERRPIVYAREIAAGMPGGIALDDGVAALYEDERRVEIVAVRNDGRAFAVDRSGEKPLPVRILS